jgi:hypothetical protein
MAYSSSTELCRIMGDAGSDKGHADLVSSWHNYTPVYYKLFKHLREKQDVHVFELGIGTLNPNIKYNMSLKGSTARAGASIFGWKQFFPQANIYAADIDTNILFQEDRIRTFYCDQTCRTTIRSMWSNPILSDKKFDIILDDGLHEFYANNTFLEESIEKVKEGGYYVIEDIRNDLISTWISKANEITQMYSDISHEFYLLDSPHNKIDNNLLVFKKWETLPPPNSFAGENTFEHLLV